MPPVPPISVPSALIVRLVADATTLIALPVEPVTLPDAVTVIGPESKPSMRIPLACPVTLPTLTEVADGPSMLVRNIASLFVF